MRCRECLTWWDLGTELGLPLRAYGRIPLIPQTSQAGRASIVHMSPSQCRSLDSQWTTEPSPPMSSLETAFSVADGQKDYWYLAQDSRVHHEKVYTGWELELVGNCGRTWSCKLSANLRTAASASLHLVIRFSTSSTVLSKSLINCDADTVSPFSTSKVEYPSNCFARAPPRSFAALDLSIPVRRAILLSSLLRWISRLMMLSTIAPFTCWM